MPTIPQLPAAISGSSTDLLVIQQSDGETHQIAPSAMSIYPASGTSSTLAGMLQNLNTLMASGTAYALVNGSSSEVFAVADATSSSDAVPLAQAQAIFAQLGVAETFTATQSARVQPLTFGSTITPNAALGNDMSVTLTGNTTLENPTNLVPGTSGHILITQDSTGGRTMAFGSYYNFGSAGVPTLSTTAGASDLVIYWVASTASIVCAFMGGV